MTWSDASRANAPLTALSKTSTIAIATAIILGAPGCAKDIPDPAGEHVDFQNPKSVLGHVFWAARTGQTKSLGSLCRPVILPDDGGSASVRRICAVTADSAEWLSFRDNFAMGKLAGEPRIATDSAVLKFHYGPDGSTAETMMLSRVGERWYLESF